MAPASMDHTPTSVACHITRHTVWCMLLLTAAVTERWGSTDVCDEPNKQSMGVVVAVDVQ